MEKQTLELAMQELEPMEAPGWWTAGGFLAGGGAAYVTVYIAVSGAAIT
jgi:hypothetical protein